MLITASGIGHVLEAPVAGWVQRRYREPQRPHQCLVGDGRLYWPCLRRGPCRGRRAFCLLLGFAALREFITLTSTRRADHWALATAFFIVLPVQYYLIAIEWYGFYSIFIPVYAFLIMPIMAVFRGDTERFLVRIAEVQWALMIQAFCASHVPALLSLDIPGFEDRNVLLIAFVIVVQLSDVLQYVWGKLFGKTSQDRAAPVAVEDCRGFRRRRAQRHADRRLPLVDHAVYAGPCGASGLHHRHHGLLWRAGDVGDQARPRRQGLGPSDRRPWRADRPAGPRWCFPHRIFFHINRFWWSLT